MSYQEELTPKSFVLAKFGKNMNIHREYLDNYTLGELIEDIEEYLQVSERIKECEGRPKCQNRNVPITEWIDYNNRYQYWLRHDYKCDMDRHMSKPNYPDYVRANDD